MSDAVQATFRSQTTPSKRRELAAVRCPDRYLLEFGSDDDGHRPLSELSGGKRVNLLLSLLLETADDRPLVIDQPEDELDNRFLFETLLPALREALVNSVAHRDYAITGAKVLLEVFASRVEVTSPGTLPNHMTTDSVRAGGMARSRNESMANYLLALGFMERRGRGWPVMRRAMQEFNGTEPEIDHGPESGFVRVRFHLGP
ncbi:MAG: hypothetical protein OXC58_04735 [Acidimicrobiaceae bacterium]|nr:hypothetical protein [Acidimicrobiaceae bacterium]